MEGIAATAAAAAEEVCVVLVYLEAVVVCLEIPPLQELDLSRHMLIKQEAVCSRQAA